MSAPNERNTRQDVVHVKKLLEVTSNTELRKHLQEQLRMCREQLRGVTLVPRLETQGTDPDNEPAAMAKKKKKKNVPITPTYSWNESDKFMKLYLTVPGLKEGQKVSCNFEVLKVVVRIPSVADKTYVLELDDLCHPIRSDQSRVQIKKDRLLLFLQKVTPDLTWGRVTKSLKASRPSFAVYGAETALRESWAIRRSGLSSTCKAELLRLMQSAGVYIIYDLKSATAALAAMDDHPPTAVHFNFLRVSFNPEMEETLTKLLEAVADCPCFLYLTMDTFLNPSGHEKDSARLDRVINGRCQLVQYYGHLSLDDVARLPDGLLSLGVAVASPGDVDVLEGAARLPMLRTLAVHTTKAVSPLDLKPLPALQSASCSLHLFFNEMRDFDSDWMTKCVAVLVGSRVIWLCFPHSQLSCEPLQMLGLFSPMTSVVAVVLDNKTISERDKDALELFYRSMSCRVLWSLDDVPLF